jgi:RNA polymerase sigma-70 factor (ECF subfamily)
VNGPLVPDAHPALVNGTAGFVTLRDGAPFAVAALTVTDGKVVAFDVLADPERLARLDLSAFGV